MKGGVSLKYLIEEIEISCFVELVEWTIKVVKEEQKELRKIK